LRKYAIQKMIHAVKIERLGTHTQTKVCKQTNFRVWVPSFLGRASHL